MFTLDVGIKSVIHGKLSCQSLLIRQTHGSESLCNRAQANPLGSCVLLSLHIRSSHNQAESLYVWIRDREVLDDCLERASRAAMVKFDCFHFGRVEGSGTVSLGLIQQIFFRNEQELC